MKRIQEKKIKGFSLVELSMVLVIISLIASSILVGDSLIENAKIRGQVTQLNSYKTALYAFRSTYNALAGDMRTANSIWPSATNGNGNGRLDAISDHYPPVYSEFLTIFQHLSVAGYIEGGYDNNLTAPVLGQSYPALKINSDFGMVSGSSEQEPGRLYGHITQQTEAATWARYKAVLYLNVCDPRSLPGSGFNDYCGVMTPVQANAIDDKIDDGKASTGDFVGHRGWNNSTNCLTAVDGDYLNTSDDSCAAFYVLAR